MNIMQVASNNRHILEFLLTYFMVCRVNRRKCCLTTKNPIEASLNLAAAALEL